MKVYHECPFYTDETGKKVTYSNDICCFKAVVRFADGRENDIYGYYDAQDDNYVIFDFGFIFDPITKVNVTDLESSYLLIIDLEAAFKKALGAEFLEITDVYESYSVLNECFKKGMSL